MIYVSTVLACSTYPVEIASSNFVQPAEVASVVGGQKAPHFRVLCKRLGQQATSLAW
jgi:hypothetical protein